jgi:hypothetical protein
MRVRRFQEYFRGLLEDASDSGIAAIEEYETPGSEGRPNLRLRGADGVTIDLVIVGTAKRGGDDHAKPEVITEKSEPGINVR